MTSDGVRLHRPDAATFSYRLLETPKMALAHLDSARSTGPATNVDRGLCIQEGKALLKLAAPIMLIGLVNMGMSVTDAAMVSVIFGADCPGRCRGW
jgi:hypothetical protein